MDAKPDPLDLWLAHRDTCETCSAGTRCKRGQKLFTAADPPGRGMTTALPGGTEPP